MTNGNTSLRISPFAAAVGLSAALVVLFVVCAIAQAIAPDWPATHAWIGLFTAAPSLSARSWIDGIVWGIVFGTVAGLVFAISYNVAVGRKQ